MVLLCDDVGQDPPVIFLSPRTVVRGSVAKARKSEHWGCCVRCEQLSQHWNGPGESER